MESSRIYIPSRSRATFAPKGTLKWIPEALRKRVTYAVPIGQVPEYKESFTKAGVAVEVLGFEYDTVYQKIKQIGQTAENRGERTFVLLDDDISEFNVRRNAEETRLRYASPDEVIELFQLVDSLLGEHCLVGVSAREGNNRYGVGSKTQLIIPYTRIMRFSAYRTKVFTSLQVDRLMNMGDFDIELQIIEGGGSVVSIAYWAQGQTKSQAPGGCADYRTLENHEASARGLKELHPEVVRLRTKHNLTDADGFGTRTEVTIGWRKAHKRALEYWNSFHSIWEVHSYQRNTHPLQMMPW